MALVTSCLALLLGIIPTRDMLHFRPRYHSISVLVYWLIDLLKGFLAAFFGLLLAGWIAAYLAAILVVIAALLPIGKGSSPFVAAGAILVFSPLLLFIGVIAFVISIFVTRYVFISTCFTIIAVILFGLVFVAHISVWLVICCLGLLVCYQQRHSYRRYSRGLEKPIKW
jgi:acyl phosphate:glycerol-3-phosphate acyltransferase